MSALHFWSGASREVLVQQIGRDRPGVRTVRGSFETTLLARGQAVLAHQAGCPAASYGQTLIHKITVHARAAVGSVR